MLQLLLFLLPFLMIFHSCLLLSDFYFSFVFNGLPFLSWIYTSSADVMYIWFVVFLHNLFWRLSCWWSPDGVAFSVRSSCFPVIAVFSYDLIDVFRFFTCLVSLPRRAYRLYSPLHWSILPHLTQYFFSMKIGFLFNQMF